MTKYKFTTYSKKIIADTITPVSLYLKIRDEFPNSILLESSDYHANDNSFSYICFNPIASFKVENQNIHIQFPNENEAINPIIEKNQVITELQKFRNAFKTETNEFKFISNGLFGYTAYDAIQYFEKINVERKSNDSTIPELYYAVYQNIIAINHFKNEAYLFCHSLNDENNISKIEQIIANRNLATYNFIKIGDTSSNISDNQFKENVAKAKQHCKRGDVFQLVLSKRFDQEFKGDEFNVYRALRNINPSPYLFYFDYGNFKIFGSSPEAQLVIQNNHAEIHPIAGTFKRTGNDEQDVELAKKLTEDTKENSEHVMLVDLARNDLSTYCNEVKVEKYKEVQYFSHVIHLVSKVVGKLKKSDADLNLVAKTFPAGTLSGAPKVKAMQLIENIETTNRSFYGGAIGMLDFNGNYNHAIMIRSFLSKNHKLYFQAGAGIVESSNEENELQEVYNKINALQKAIELAETI
ncbi:anthranilate synthase component I family protein [Flavobacterium okayamense]|uniref:Anthranilate synthase component 1 n=1 Tax=Flavobacterium okayamense TaxID=2830782 RepID=A0ABN6HXY9_9FLAO|nr:anthranilate synthase component I family protein [Flavobacterium okayamense]BCY29269.1 anthranilate synthase component I [Flavobacterium okayamense]